MGSELKNRVVGLLASVFDVFVVELIGECAWKKIGVEFEV